MTYETIIIDVPTLSIENQKKIIDLDSVHQIGCNQMGEYYAIVKEKQASKEIMDILAVDTIENWEKTK